VISEEVLSQIGIKDYHTKFTSLKVANGVTMASLGEIDIPTTIGDELHIITYRIVKQLPAGIIIGVDALHQMQCSAHFGEMTLHLENGTVVPGIENGIPILCTHSISLPPLSRTLVECASPSPALLEGDECFYVEPAVTIPTGLMVAKSINSSVNATSLEVMNLSSESFSLHANTQLGNAFRIKSLQQMDCMHISSSPQSSSSASQDDVININKIFTDMMEKNTFLNKQEKEMFLAFLQKNIDVFAVDPLKLTQTDFYHHIETDGAPVKQRPHRLPHSQMETIDNEIEQMLKARIIEPSDSPWSSPIVLVKKKDGGTRFCIDFRKVNEVTKRDSYPLPRIDATLDLLAGSKIFSTLDCFSGFWQIQLDDESKEKTAFTTRGGLYQFRVLPFGLTNAPSCFQRTMEQVFAGLTLETCLIYIDDIVVFARDFKSHLQRLQQVFDRIRKYGFKLKAKKCHFGEPKLLFLGHMISEQGVSCDPAKIEVIKNLSPPRTVRQVRRFLGICSYYRRFVAKFAKLAEPLTKLLHKDEPFKWGEAQQTSFEDLKERLVTAPVLSYPDFRKTFTLQTDASGYSLGAILSQDDKVIAYASRNLSPAEQKYTVTELECLAIIYGTDIFYAYLYGRHFHIVTDHSALAYLKNSKQIRGRIARWSLKLQELDFEVHHRSGKKSGNVDFLSRLNEPETTDYVSINSSSTVNSCSTSSSCTPSVPDGFLSINALTSEQLSLAVDTNRELNDISAMQQKDDQLKPVFDYLANQSLPKQKKLRKMLMKDGQHFKLLNNVLYFDKPPIHNAFLEPKPSFLRLVVPSELQVSIIARHHDDAFGGHLSFKKIFPTIEKKYFWFWMRRDIRKYVTACIDCQLGKSATLAKSGLLEPIEVAEPFQKVCMDYLGPLPSTGRGNKYLLVLVDMLTKWPEAYALPDRKATTVARVIATEFIPRYGAVQELLSDNGPEFRSELIQEISNTFNIHKVFSSAYHPQSQGITENMNKNLLHMVKLYINEDQNDWDIYVNFILFAYRSAMHSSTFFSPFYLVYGRDPLLPSEINYGLRFPRVKNIKEHKDLLDQRLSRAYEIVRQNLKQQQLVQKEHFDKHRRVVEYPVGTYVWLYVPATKPGHKLKLSKLWHGPYIVVGKRTDNTVLIQTLQKDGRKQFVHVERLKLFTDPDHPPMDSPKLKHRVSNPKELDEYLMLEYNDDGITHTKSDWNEYPVEKIVDERMIDGRKEYLIKWERWPEQYNSWVAETDCGNCKRKIREFERKRRAAATD
jgi:hypothetical protein